MNFNPGDKIRLISRSWGGVFWNKIGIVSHKLPDGTYGQAYEINLVNGPCKRTAAYASAMRLWPPIKVRV